jgi:hypothetical protein
MYVTGLCQGSPSLDSGKFHNHCTQCPEFGVCIGDYREAHCGNCGKHWFCGNSSFPCSWCGREDGDYDDEFGHADLADLSVRMLRQ